MPEHFGRCNREDKCGYHATPSFSDSGPLQAVQPKRAKQMKPNSDYIAGKIWRQTIREYEINPLWVFFADKFGKGVATTLFKRYLIGTSKKWNGATIFWQIDNKGVCRSGKVMGYDSETGKRVKKPYSQQTWAHTALGLDEFNLEQCLFGLHLYEPGKIIYLFESEKTALIASLFFKDVICMATGGKMQFKQGMLWPIRKAKSIVAYPDLGCFEDWSVKAYEMPFDNIQVSDMLEATAQGQEDGIDIADILLADIDKNFGWVLKDGYPAFWDMNS